VKYGLDDLKPIVDECMQDLTVTPQQQQFLIQKCMTSKQVYSKKHRSILLTASGFAACAAAACLITVAIRSKPVFSSPVSTNSTVTTANESEFLRVASQSDSNGLTLNGFTLTQNEDGLWGLKNPKSEWVVSPIYTKAYFENTTAYFFLSEASVFSSEASQVYSIPTVVTTK